MGVVKTDTNFNGSVANIIYKDVAEGNEVIEEGIARLELRVRDKVELGSLRQTARPFDAYATTPTGDSVTTNYDKRNLSVFKLMAYEEFDPQDWLDFWEKWGSAGTMTELRMNSAFMADLFELLSENMGSHIAELFFAGDTGGVVAKLAYFDGLVTKALADANVIDAVTDGVITALNIKTVLSNVVDAIPEKDYKNDKYKILVSMADYKLIQRANTTVKEANDGFLDDTVKDMFEQKRIIPFVNMPKNYMVATRVGTDQMSNLVLGFWFDQKNEERDMRVDRLANNSDDWFYRMNIRLGMNYVYSENVILYSPV